MQFKFISYLNIEFLKVKFLRYRKIESDKSRNLDSHLLNLGNNHFKSSYTLCCFCKAIEKMLYMKYRK